MLTSRVSNERGGFPAGFPPASAAPPTSGRGVRGGLAAPGRTPPNSEGDAFEPVSERPFRGWRGPSRSGRAPRSPPRAAPPAGDGGAQRSSRGWGGEGEAAGTRAGLGAPGLPRQQPRRVGAAEPRGKDAASEISDVFLLLPGATEALRTRPGNRGRNQAGIPPQGLKGCSGLWCLQVIGTARCRSRQSPLSFLGWGRGEDAVNTKHDLAGGKKSFLKLRELGSLRVFGSRVILN